MHDMFAQKYGKSETLDKHNNSNNKHLPVILIIDSFLREFSYSGRLWLSRSQVI